MRDLKLNSCLTSLAEASKSLLNEVEDNVDHISYIFDNETTPVKACGDLAYYVSNNGTKFHHLTLIRLIEANLFGSQIMYAFFVYGTFLDPKW